MAELDKQRSPSYYVRQRLYKNKGAMLGLIIVGFAHLVAALGYLIMPDSTPNADGGSSLIGKTSFFHTLTMLKQKKQNEVEHVNIFKRIFVGQESDYMAEPVTTYRVEGDTLYFVVGREQNELKLPLLPVVRLLDNSKEIRKVVGSLADTLVYTDPNGQIQRITVDELQKEFEKDNIEKRTFYLGTNNEGRDIMSMLILGTRISLSIGFISMLISLILGVTLGAIAGFFGGMLDKVIFWIMTVVWSIPNVMLVVAITLAFQTKGIWVAFIAVGLTMWVDIARVVRGEMMAIKEKVFVEAAKAFGLSNFHIIYKHILPNIMGSLIVVATSNFAMAILTEAGLSFLGLGVQAPTPSWGMMIKEGKDDLFSPTYWHLAFLPSFCISMLVLAFNLLGNGLRDAYDPQMLEK